MNLEDVIASVTPEKIDDPADIPPQGSNSFIGLVDMSD